MLWNKFNLFTFKIICSIILSITKKTPRNGNLASWKIIQAPPTTVSLFWFYYSVLTALLCPAPRYLTWTWPNL